MKVHVSPYHLPISLILLFLEVSLVLKVVTMVFEAWCSFFSLSPVVFLGEIWVCFDLHEAHLVGLSSLSCAEVPYPAEVVVARQWVRGVTDGDQ